jgi:hypothetical protein
MINLGLLPKFTIDAAHKCETCTESKFARQTFKSVFGRSNDVLGLIHSDLCDFKATPTRGGKNYYITFIDDCSKYCYVYLIHSKDEALNMFKTYKAEVENQLEKKIKILRSDRGGEYEFNAFAEFCSFTWNYSSNNCTLHPTAKWGCRTKKSNFQGYDKFHAK